MRLVELANDNEALRNIVGIAAWQSACVKRTTGELTKLEQEAESYYYKSTVYFRDVVQPGRALAWGARSRRFESSRPDQ